MIVIRIFLYYAVLARGKFNVLERALRSLVISEGIVVGREHSAPEDAVASIGRRRGKRVEYSW